MARRPKPAETEALAAFAQQLEGIKHGFAEVDRQDAHFALYGVETQRHAYDAIAIDEWGTLLVAVTSRLRLAIGDARTPGMNDTPAALRASVLECVDALDQLHAMLGERRLGAMSHVSCVPVSTPPLLNRALAALAND